MGLPGPTPRFFFGNLIELFTHSRHSAACLADWTREYGKIFGYYIGHTPVICVSDPDLLQEIFITKFSHFHSRRPLPLQQHHLRHLLASKDDEWKRQRSIIQPTFSSSKLKEMRTIIDQCITELIEQLDQQKPNVDFNISSLFKRTSMNILLNCAFGINSNTHEKLSESFFQRCLQVFEFNMFQSILTTCSILLPELNCLWVTCFKYTNIFRLWLCDHIPFMNRFIDTDPNTWLLYHVESIIKQRCLNGIERIDLLQSMIDATDVFQKISYSSKLSKYRLKLDELLNNIYLFMLGGYETTATALGYLAFILATHQHEQARLQNEIDDVHDDYEQIIKLDYLDWFIRETLRLYPIAPFIVNRQCNKSCRIGQLEIEEGTNFTVDMYSIHYNEKLYGPVSPSKFYPERFQEKRHPLAWLPFGVGPRNCVGMRFAMLEIKLALVQILRRYTILSGEHTLSQFAEHERFVIAPKNGVWIRLQRRSSQIRECNYFNN
ncbi:unnamed protein product [Rotaria sp. Silwood1]|nr:unnamed protein product [Rotaria sp. Silwood1]CAF1001933.1 unnamed protein product [Rotaria sp. Silwood1]CAF3386892.1 unnamed protein product [Rotaria sp. Silwood1]CAF3411288.1 unnamed protein product [Rotaria sp. Silwood1]CAF3429521.1 unnamed protein product [Rotaria sp. Silwood1]